MDFTMVSAELGLWHNARELSEELGESPDIRKIICLPPFRMRTLNNSEIYVCDESRLIATACTCFKNNRRFVQSCRPFSCEWIARPEDAAVGAAPIGC